MIDADTDVTAWQLEHRALEQRLIRATQQATTRGVLLVERLTKQYLRTFTHPEGTPTPSPPGGPPALVTGQLRQSVKAIPAHPGRMPDTCEATVGPTKIYSRIQELGGTIRQTRDRRLRSGAMITRAVTIRIPRRPSLKPMTLAARREIRRGYLVMWTNAIRGS